MLVKLLAIAPALGWVRARVCVECVSVYLYVCSVCVRISVRMCE